MEEDLLNETVAFTGMMAAVMGPLFPLYGVQVKWAHRAFRYPEWSDSLAIGGYFVIAGVAATAMVFEAFSARDELSIGAALTLLGVARRSSSLDDLLRSG